MRLKASSWWLKVPTSPRLIRPLNSAALSQNVFYNVFDALLRIGSDGAVLPGLAEEWSSEADGSVWTFKIRPNVVFHDGTPLTVEDVIWTYEKILADAKSPLRGYISYIKGLSKVDDRTVRIELGKKFIPFDRWTTNIYIISKRAFDKVGAAEFQRSRLLGSIQGRGMEKGRNHLLEGSPRVLGRSAEA